jgi:hypothetical protein
MCSLSQHITVGSSGYNFEYKGSDMNGDTSDSDTEALQHSIKISKAKPLPLSGVHHHILTHTFSAATTVLLLRQPVLVLQ